VGTLGLRSVQEAVPPISSSTFRAVREAVHADLVRVSSHALEEAAADQLRIGEITDITRRGECIEDYPTDPRGPSCLVLGHLSDRSAVHALWGFDQVSRQAILITVYRPDPARWSEDCRKRRSRDVGEAE
jgi:hypothetical protein